MRLKLHHWAKTTNGGNPDDNRDDRHAHADRRPSRIDPQPLPFARDLAVRAFLLERDAGNILIYSSGELAADAERSGRSAACRGNT